MEKVNIKLVLEYDGTNYHGWQKQKNASTVQETLENAIYKLTQETVRVIAAGRTDTGVHARGQVVNFFIKKKLALEKIKLGLNAYLPADIVVKKVEEVPAEFHARYDAKKRIYQYFIKFGTTAIYRNYCWQFFQKVDRDILSDLASRIVGEHDFSAFCRIKTEVKNKVCRVYESYWREEDGFSIYCIVANRFLHGMVRSLVGTMIDVARGYFTIDQFNEILQSRNRRQAGISAPARGLFLEEVIYN